MFPRRSHRSRVNIMPPSGAAYYDPQVLACTPCDQGSSNVCRAQTLPSTTPSEGDFDWVLEQQRRLKSGVVAAAVSDCCVTDIDANTGFEVSICDVSKGCGWVTLPNTNPTNCIFTTQGATYPTLRECSATIQGIGPVAVGTGDWFPPCSDTDQINCYYSSVDECLPAIFGKPKLANSTQCAAYLCRGQAKMDNGKLTFPHGACTCVPK